MYALALGLLSWKTERRREKVRTVPRILNDDYDDGEDDIQNLGFKWDADVKLLRK